MSALSSFGAYVFGFYLGHLPAIVPLFVTSLINNNSVAMYLEKSSWGRGAKKASFIALHVLVTVAAVAAHAAIPHMGFSFLATCILQGALVAPLIMAGMCLENGSVHRSQEEFYNHNEDIVPSVMISGLTCFYWDTPFIATAGIIHVLVHVKSIFTC